MERLERLELSLFYDASLTPFPVGDICFARDKLSNFHIELGGY
jgi:hypothetical protein